MIDPKPDDEPILFSSILFNKIYKKSCKDSASAKVDDGDAKYNNESLKSLNSFCKIENSSLLPLLIASIKCCKSLM